MFQLLRQSTVRELAFKQVPSFSGAFLIASFFYRFHSFALESVAFLATWFVLDALISFVEGLVRPRMMEKARAD